MKLRGQRSMFRILPYILLVLFNYALAQGNEKYSAPDYFIPTPHEVGLTKTEGKSFYQQKERWQDIIDSTWGSGLPLVEKQNIFNTFAQALDKEFPLFPNLSFSWDSLKTHYFNQITSTTSKGRFAAIMGHLAYKLQDVHTSVRNTEVLSTPLNPGTPILVLGTTDVRHFGAVLTVGLDSSIIVLKVVDNHPLNLQPGDIILGYEGVPWNVLVEELLEAKLPITGYWGGCESAYYDAKLKSAGTNWHLFESIDVKKHNTGEVLSLSLDPMSDLSVGENYPQNSEQLEISNIPFPTFNGQTGTTVSYGKLENTNIGFIYLIAENADQTNEEFFQAVESLRNTDGLIIDLRYNTGGNLSVDFEDAFDILFNTILETFNPVKRCSPNNWNLCPEAGTYNFNISAETNSFYEKPIALLLGPNCGSMGDITTYRLMYHPNVRLFGKSSSASPSLSSTINTFDGWVIKYARTDMRKVSDPNYFYCQKEVPIDYPVWFNKDDVAIGFDSVLEEAKEYVSNLTCTYNAAIINYSDGEIIFSANVFNPNSHSVSVIAEVINDNEVVDSLECFVQNNKIIEALNMSELPKDFYTVNIITKDIEDSTIHTLPNILKFTTAGPIKVEAYLAYNVSDERLRVKNITLVNKDSQKTFTNVKVDLYCNDSSVTKISKGVFFQDLEPGQKRTITESIYIDVDEIKQYKFIAEINSDNDFYWLDTIYFTPAVNVKEALGLPEEYSLEQNYPNPFNPTTTINYSIPTQSTVILKVYNMLGSEIETLVNEEQKAGFYEINWYAENNSSGVYFYRISTGSYSDTKKMLLIK